MRLVASHHRHVRGADGHPGCLEEPGRRIMVGVAVSDEDGLNLPGLDALGLQLGDDGSARGIEPCIDLMTKLIARFCAGGGGS